MLPDGHAKSGLLQCCRAMSPSSCPRPCGDDHGNKAPKPRSSLTFAAGGAFSCTFFGCSGLLSFLGAAGAGLFLPSYFMGSLAISTSPITLANCGWCTSVMNHLVTAGNSFAKDPSNTCAMQCGGQLPSSSHDLCHDVLCAETAGQEACSRGLQRPAKHAWVAELDSTFV